MEYQHLEASMAPPVAEGLAPAPPSIAGPSGSSPAPPVKQAYTSPYHAFCKDERPLLPPGLRNAQRETLLGQKWKALSAAERAKYKVGQAACVRPFHVFCQHQRPLLPPTLRNAEREKLLGTMWKALSSAEKAIFSDVGAADPAAVPVYVVASAVQAAGPSSSSSAAVQPARGAAWSKSAAWQLHRGLRRLKAPSPSRLHDCTTALMAARSRAWAAWAPQWSLGALEPWSLGAPPRRRPERRFVPPLTI